MWCVYHLCCDWFVCHAVRVIWALLRIHNDCLTHCELIFRVFVHMVSLDHLDAPWLTLWFLYVFLHLIVFFCWIWTASYVVFLMFCYTMTFRLTHCAFYVCIYTFRVVTVARTRARCLPLVSTRVNSYRCWCTSNSSGNRRLRHAQISVCNVMLGWKCICWKLMLGINLIL